MMRKRFVPALTGGLVLVSWLTGTPLQAQHELRTTELIVFKNGTYFVVKEGSLPVDNSQARMELPPSPLLGTFWLTTQKDLSISRLSFMSDTLKKNRPARSLTELIRSNKGKKVKLIYRLDEKNTGELAGTLQDFFVQTGLVKLKMTDGKTAYIPSGDVRQFFVDDNPSEMLSGDSIAYMARIVFDRNPADARLKLVYMQPGIQWFPSYNVKILNDKELQLEMRALVENFAEVVKDAKLTLTVGDPNYRYGRMVEQFASPYLTAIGGNTGYNPYQTYQFQNVPSARGMAENVDASYQDYRIYTTEGEKTGDLYMYDVGRVSIPKNSKASFQIFSQKVQYKDVYKVSLGDVVNYAASRMIYNNPDLKFEVYHSLKIANSTKNPFTTAPVFVMDEELRPLAQDEISYTPVSGTVSVNLSRSPDIVIKNREEERDRAERAMVVDKHTYTRVTIRGNIDLQNTLEKRVLLNVEKSLTGQVLEVSDGGNIIAPPTGSGLNPFNRAEWEISVGAGEKKTITYSYEVYILVN